MTEFRGFGPKTTKFLRDLGRHNDKAWFDAHRNEYEQHYLEPAKAFVEAAGPRLEKLAPKIVWEPRVNGSISSAKFTTHCIREWKKLAPLHRWLMEHVA